MPEAAGYNGTKVRTRNLEKKVFANRRSAVLLATALTVSGYVVFLGALVAAGAAALVAAPVIEEIVFRGGLQSLLARNRTLRLAHVGPIGAANALASVGFAAGHVVMRDSMAVALVFLPSLVLGWLYDRCGRLGPVIGVHASYNLAWLTLLGPG